MVQTKEQQKAYQKIYRGKNKQKTSEYNRAYRAKHTQKYKDYLAEYRHTDAGKRSARISKWKSRGLIHDNYHELYDAYLLNEFCDVCKIKYQGTNKRCLDHDHESGLFRQFLCLKCNIYDKWKQIKLEEELNLLKQEIC